MNAPNILDSVSAVLSLTRTKSIMLLILGSLLTRATSKAFTGLRDELAGTENRIAVARRDYNGVVQDFNLFII